MGPGHKWGSLQVSTFRYIADNWDTLEPQIVTHVLIVAITIAVASAIGLVLGVAAARWDRLGNVVLAVTSTLITIPSFALFGLLSIWVGLGSPPVVVGLVLYALLPVTRNTRAGILAVDPAVVEAARGMGMSPRQVLTRVELPLAVPVILAGVRQATVMVVAIATVGATVGANDLGQPILAAIGRTTGTLDTVLAGIIPVAVIGILADLILALVQRSLARGRVAVAAT
jgi:osmoprotectant transport system permease protein